MNRYQRMRLAALDLMRERWMTGEEIAQECGCSLMTAYRIVRRHADQLKERQKTRIYPRGPVPREFAVTRAHGWRV